MFVEYYKLTEQPFGVTPNPKFLYLTPTHREAIASIVYGVMENRGFSALIAPPGMGKTTLMFELLHRCGDSVRSAFLFQFQPSPEGLLRNLLSELGVSVDESSFEEMQEKLNQLILEESKKGKRIVVVVDEAQNFREPVLEVLRMLSNFETNRDKLIHIVLSGQPQLAEMLFSPAIEQLRQRISIMAVLRPLNAEETREYIEHRLRVAGYRGARPIFTTEACDRIAHYSSGIPRNINNLCFNSMSLGYALKRPTIDPGVVDEVYRDLNLESSNDISISTMNMPSASSNAWPRPAASMSAMWPPPRTAQTAGKGLGFSVGLIVFAAVLCVGGVIARQYAIPENQSNISLHAPAPPVPQVEIATPSAAPVEAAPEKPPDLQSAAQPETKLEPKPGSEAKAIPTEPLPVAAIVKQQPSQQGRRTPEPEQVRVKLLRVSRRESLYELCANNFGVCDGKAINEIQRLNPRLRNSTHVEAGEAIRLPLDAPWRSRFRPGSKTSSGSKR